MSDNETFLARWSRRKRRAPAQADAGNRTKPAEPVTAAAPVNVQARPPKSGEGADPDLQSLPPLSAIGAESDIRGFLAPGVPGDLTRAALRRVWAADPAIRDFIGLSENAWDFNAEGGVPGFGTLPAEEAASLLERLVGPLTAPPETETAEKFQATAPAGPKAGQAVPVHSVASAVPPESTAGCAGQDLEVSLPGSASSSQTLAEDGAPAALETPGSKGEAHPGPARRGIA